MKILDSKFMKGFIKMADDGFQQAGMRERWKLKLSSESRRSRNDPSPSECTRRVAAYRHRGAGTCRRVFPGTGSGKYFRNIAVDPEACLAIIELDDKGVNYRIRWGL